MDRTYRYLDTDTLARLVDELYDEVCIYDNHYRMVYINKACLRHYGFEPDDLIGKELTIFEHDKWWDTSILPHVYRDKKSLCHTSEDDCGLQTVYRRCPDL